MASAGWSAKWYGTVKIMEAALMSCRWQALDTSRHHPERYFNNIFYSTRGVIFLDTPNHGVGRASWAEAMFLSTSLIEQTNSEHYNNLRRDFEVISDIQDHFHSLVNEHSAEIQPQIEVLYLYEGSPNLVRQVKPGFFPNTNDRA